MAHNINININFVQAEASISALIQASTALNEVITKLKTTISSYNGAVGNSSNANSKGKKSIADYTGSYKDLAATIAKTRKEYDRELQALAALRGQTDRNVASETALVAKVKELEVALKLQISTLKQYNSALGISATKSNVASAATSKLGGSMSILGTLKSGFGSLAAVSGGSLGVYGAFRVFKDMIVTVTEFDLAAKKLRSILGETNEGMKDIEDSAIAVGKASIFGATGVVELQIELAKMGFVKGEIIAMQQAIVNLATATQEELAPSAEVVANIIRSFGLSAGQATMVVDVMGKAFNDSALDLSNFREAIKYVAPVARQANFTFQETVALLEALSNAGIKGSLAGTGLTNILSRLGNENSKFVKTLGHTVDGFDGLISGMIELKKRGVDLPAVFQLVDRRAAATFSILLEGVDTVQQFKDKLMESGGVMEQQTAVQLESITYQSRLLSESWKAMIIEMDKGNGVLSETVKWFLRLGQSMVIAMGDPIKSVYATEDKLSRLTTSIRTMVNEEWLKLNVDDKARYDELLKNAMWYYVQLADLETKYQEEVQKQINRPVGVNPMHMAHLKNQLKKDIEELNKEFPGISSNIEALKQETIDAATKPYVDAFLELAKTSGDAGKAFEIQIGRLQELEKLYKNNADKVLVLKSAVNKINDEYKKMSDFEMPEIGGDNAKKAGQEKLASDLAILEAEKKIAAEKIELDNNIAKSAIETQLALDTIAKDTASGDTELQLIKRIADNKEKLAGLEYDKTIKLRKNEFDFEVLIAERKRLFDKQYADDKANAEIIYNKEKLLREITLQNDLNAIEGKTNIEAIKRQAELEKEVREFNIQKIEEALKVGNELNDIEKSIAENTIKLKRKSSEKEREIIESNFDFEEKKLNDNYIAAIAIAKLKGEDTLKITKIYLKKIQDLESGKEEALNEPINIKKRLNLNNQSLGELLGFQEGSDEAIIIDDTFQKIEDGLVQLTDAWVEAADKIVETRNRMVDEAEQALQTEIQLAEQGFASNVTLKRKELAEAKRLQKEALENQAKANKAQAKMDAAMQASSLIVAAANVFKEGSKLGLWGIPIAIGLIFSMIATFVSMQKKIKAASVPVFGKGGWVHGKSHSQGGTLVEAEKDEFIVNKKSAVKYRTILESINRDEKITIDRVHMNRFKDGVLTAKVSLDDSKDLKAIRKILEQREKSIEFKDGYRIERYGSMLTKIKLN